MWHFATPRSTIKKKEQRTGGTDMMADAHANDLLSEMVNATEHSDVDGVSIVYGSIDVDGAFNGAAWTEATWIDANGAARRFRVRIEPII